MTSAEKSAVAPLPGRTIAQHRILEKIGAGGRGEVYLAHDAHYGVDAVDFFAL